MLEAARLVADEEELEGAVEDDVGDVVEGTVEVDDGVEAPFGFCNCSFPVS